MFWQGDMAEEGGAMPGGHAAALAALHGGVRRHGGDVLASGPLAPVHGGRLLAAVQQYGRPRQDWLDLSAALNPQPWPVPPVPAEVWQRLPEREDELPAVARAYYACDVLPVAGSQAAIQALPGLRRSGQVVVMAPSYAEHAWQWGRAGHRVVTVEAERWWQRAAHAEVAICVNPNNPTGTCLAPDHLLTLARLMSARGGWLIVDEAFIDPVAGHSVAPWAGRPGCEGLIVLRSVGKFFGLAGLRLGFVAAHPLIRARLDEVLGPWAVNGPARWLGVRLLADVAWQQAAIGQLQAGQEALRDVVGAHGWTVHGHTPLFVTVAVADPLACADALAREGVLVRAFPEFGLLRFGLPAAGAPLARVQQALAACGTICPPR